MPKMQWEYFMSAELPASIQPTGNLGNLGNADIVNIKEIRSILGT